MLDAMPIAIASDCSMPKIVGALGFDSGTKMLGATVGALVILLA